MCIQLVFECSVLFVFCLTCMTISRVVCRCVRRFETKHFWDFDKVVISNSCELNLLLGDEVWYNEIEHKNIFSYSLSLADSVLVSTEVSSSTSFSQHRNILFLQNLEIAIGSFPLLWLQRDFSSRMQSCVITSSWIYYYLHKLIRWMDAGLNEWYAWILCWCKCWCKRMLVFGLWC